LFNALIVVSNVAAIVGAIVVVLDAASLVTARTKKFGSRFCIVICSDNASSHSLQKYNDAKANAPLRFRLCSLSFFTNQLAPAPKRSF
jgi:hypothetical protein